MIEVIAGCLLVASGLSTAWSTYKVVELSTKEEELTTREKVELAGHAASACLGVAGLAFKAAGAVVSTAAGVAGQIVYVQEGAHLVEYTLTAADVTANVARYAPVVSGLRDASLAVSGLGNVVAAVGEGVQIHTTLTEREEEDAIRRRLPTVPPDKHSPLEWREMYTPAYGAIPETYEEGEAIARSRDNPIFSLRMWQPPDLDHQIPIRCPIVVDGNVLEYGFHILCLRDLLHRELGEGETRPTEESVAHLEDEAWRQLDVDGHDSIVGEMRRLGMPCPGA